MALRLPAAPRHAPALGLGLALALLLGWCVGRGGDGGPADSLVELREVAEDVHLPRVRVLAEPPYTIPERPESWRFHLAVEVAEQVFGPFGARTRYDPWTWRRSAPGRSETLPWPEHPAGRWTLTTNSDGLHMERDVDLEPGLDVLVLGDSHAFGMLDAIDTFAARLERELRARRAVARVVNAAQPGFGPIEALGSLYAWLPARPRLVVHTFFEGNDFVDLVRLAQRFEEGTRLALSEERERRFLSAARRAPHATGQGFAGYVLGDRPELRERAADLALGLLREAHAACAARGARLVVVLLPAPSDLAWEPPHAELDRARRLLALALDAGSGLLDCGERLRGGLVASEIAWIDGRELFAECENPPYWRRDLHLDLTGHALVARALDAYLESPPR